MQLNAKKWQLTASRAIRWRVEFAHEPKESVRCRSAKLFGPSDRRLAREARSATLSDVRVEADLRSSETIQDLSLRDPTDIQIRRALFDTIMNRAMADENLWIYTRGCGDAPRK